LFEREKRFELSTSTLASLPSERQSAESCISAAHGAAGESPHSTAIRQGCPIVLPKPGRVWEPVLTATLRAYADRLAAMVA
jgi:hypothetical protein